jgi:hypothetical protein
VDIDLQRIAECRESVRQAGVSDRVRFVCGNLFDIDVREASVVALYLLPGLNVRLRPKLLWELRPGARIISNNFPMGDWPPEATVTLNHRELYRWTVPAWAQGKWKVTIAPPPDQPRGVRTHFELNLHRHYQHLSGAARFGRHDVPIVGGQICGDIVRFTLSHADHFWPPAAFEARLVGSTLRGTCRGVGDGAADRAWGGIRI